MDCCEFREKYSDFADGLLEETALALARRHLEACPACRRFDAAFRAGLSALRDLPAVEVSRNFGDRLKSRIRHEWSVRPLAVDPFSGAVAALLVLVTVGFVAWDVYGIRAGRRQTPVAVTAPAQVTIRIPAPIAIQLDTAWIFGAGFHPFDPALLVAETTSVTYASQARFDIPAVWGGR